MTDRKIVAVTGVGGLLGGALATRLLHAGYPVRGLARRPETSVPLPSDLTVVAGSLSDPSALVKLVVSADTVFHIAAMYRSDGDWDAFAETNWLGTKRLLSESQLAGVRRFVYCSTIGVHGSVSTSPADETAPLDPRDNYQRSKVLAEEACREAMGGEMEIIILRPCGIYGPGDLRMLKMFKMLQRRTFVQVGAGKANFHPVFIDDLVEGFMLGMTVDDIDGETFIIGGPDYLPLAEFIATAASALSAPKPWIHVPYGAMEAAARLCEAVCSPIGLQPPLHRRRLTFFKHNRAFSIDKACQRLGYAPKVRLPEGFAKTVQWYRQEKLLA